MRTDYKDVIALIEIRLKDCKSSGFSERVVVDHGPVEGIFKEFGW